MIEEKRREEQKKSFLFGEVRYKDISLLQFIEAKNNRIEEKESKKFGSFSGYVLIEIKTLEIWETLFFLCFSFDSNCGNF